MSGVLREPRFSFFGRLASKAVPPHEADAGQVSGCVPLSLEKKPAAKKSRAFALGALDGFRTGGSFSLGSSFVGALLATKSYDLRGVANRTILHVAAEHPSLREGERNFFVLRWRGLGASCRD